MTFRRLAPLVAILAAVAFTQSGCLAAAAVGTVAGTAVGVTGAVVGGAGKAVVATGKAVIPGGGKKDRAERDDYRR
ncbi:hypothetical protein [uncultured Caulobacter sp.]|uniref:hypothetical protein n=1 Tax=uncultured Caulobacter sp. TaxID=158749 RepID=UPI00262AAB1D|nr:hypothetical protein [uncultured Caulobacter sp.]